MVSIIAQYNSIIVCHKAQNIEYIPWTYCLIH